MEKSTTKRNPTIKEAIFILLTVIGVILLCLSNALVLETALVLGSMTAALFSIYLGYNWSDI